MTESGCCGRLAADCPRRSEFAVVGCWRGGRTGRGPMSPGVSGGVLKLAAGMRLRSAVSASTCAAGYGLLAGRSDMGQVLSGQRSVARDLGHRSSLDNTADHLQLRLHAQSAAYSPCPRNCAEKARVIPPLANYTNGYDSTKAFRHSTHPNCQMRIYEPMAADITTTNTFCRELTHREEAAG